MRLCQLPGKGGLQLETKVKNGRIIYQLVKKRELTEGQAAPAAVGTCPPLADRLTNNMFH
jgi:hypothetical protein